MRARRRSDRKWRPIGICGSDWAAIQKPSSNGSIRGKARRGRDPSLKRGKRVEAEGEKNPHATNILLLLFPPNVPSFPSRRLQGWQPNRWVNFFAAQFNEASLNSLPGAADRSRGTNGGRAAGCGGWKGWERRKGGREGGTSHRRRFVNRPLATLQCGRKVRERGEFHWPARSRPCA